MKSYNELQDYINEIPKNIDLFVTCQVELRGCLAAQISTKNRFKVNKFDGGYKTYSEVFGKQ